MIAATAIEMNCPAISRDSAVDEIEGRFGSRGRAWQTPRRGAHQPLSLPMPTTSVWRQV